MDFIFRILPLCFLFTSCTFLVYHPDNYLHNHPDNYKTDFKILSVPSTDNVSISAWRLLSKSGKPENLVLYFHGNAQNITSHFANLVWLAEHKTDVIIFDYRGYGRSTGEPEPKGVSEDGLALLNYAYDLKKSEGIKNFYIYTQSLGGAVALRSLEDFKHRDEIKLLVLDSTFLSPRDVAKDKVFWPIYYLISNDYTADRKLSHLTMPILSIHSKNDPVISYKLGEKLYNSITSSPKKEFWTLEEKGHGDVFFIDKGSYREKFLNFLRQLP